MACRKRKNSRATLDFLFLFFVIDSVAAIPIRCYFLEQSVASHGMSWCLNGSHEASRSEERLHLYLCIFDHYCAGLLLLILSQHLDLESDAGNWEL